jgi:hypothetical protein
MLRPTYLTRVGGDVVRFEWAYRAMEALLREAADAVDEAAPVVPGPARLLFGSEASAIRWFYRTARTHANFFESCRLRDGLLGTVDPAGQAGEAGRAKVVAALARWREVLLDERENTRAAVPLMEADVRLDPYYGGDHNFSHGLAMLRAKLTLLDQEVGDFLPSVERRLLG